MKSNLGKSILVYTLSNLMSSALPFLFLPFLTFYLSAEDYGILSNLTGFLAIVMPVIGINFVSAFSRQYYKSELDIKSYVRTGISIQFGLSLFISFLFLIFENYIKNKTGIDIIFIRLTSLYCLVFGLSEIILTQWRLENKIWNFAIYRVARTLFEIGLTIFLIVSLGMNYKGRIIGIFLATAIGFIPILILFFKKGYLSFSFNFNHAKHIFRFGIPLIPHALGASIIVFSDKIVITNLINIEANGIYSVAFQVALIIGLIQNSFNQAWVPWFYNSLSNKGDEIKKEIVKLTYLYYLGLLVLTILLVIGTPYIFMLLDKEFYLGRDLVAFIAFGFMFNGMYKMVVNYLFYTEKTIIIGSITIVSALMNIILNIFLVDSYGLKGAAIATSFTFLIQFILVWFFAQKFFPMPWINFRK